MRGSFRIFEGVDAKEKEQKRTKKKKNKRKDIFQKRKRIKEEEKKKEEKCMSCRLSLTLQRGCYHGVT